VYHSVSNHPSDSCYRFLTLPLSVTGYFRASPFTSRLASLFRPFRVRHPTDWYTVFCCSPPCVATTQLLRLTGRRERARRELSSLMPGLLMGALVRPSRPLNHFWVMVCPAGETPAPRGQKIFARLQESQRSITDSNKHLSKSVFICVHLWLFS
jgi:hypothetical protein